MTKVLDNGNLFVEGKVLALSEGSEEVFISGIITPKDVQPDNTILSSRITQADVCIADGVMWPMWRLPAGVRDSSTNYGHFDMNVFSKIVLFLCIVFSSSLAADRVKDLTSVAR